MTDAPEKKISLLDMILHLEEEIGDIDTWERVLHSEGEPLYPRKLQHRQILKKILSTLELVKHHEKAFVTMVQAGRRENARLKSIELSSKKSTTTSVPTESPEPSNEQ